jgi:hypothetical protein
MRMMMIMFLPISFLSSFACMRSKAILLIVMLSLLFSIVLPPLVWIIPHLQSDTYCQLLGNEYPLLFLIIGIVYRLEFALVDTLAFRKIAFGLCAFYIMDAILTSASITRIIIISPAFPSHR